jgi:hypothetical protein
MFAAVRREQQMDGKNIVQAEGNFHNLYSASNITGMIISRRS